MPFKSWIAEPPGTGGRVDVLIAAYYPPPTPFEQNPTWHAVNTRLNADVRMNIIPATDWRTKFATTMAGGDLPDIIHVYFGVPWTPNTVPFIRRRPRTSPRFSRVMPSRTTRTWRQFRPMPGRIRIRPLMASCISGPSTATYRGLSYFFKNTDIFDQEIGLATFRRTRRDFRKILEQLNVRNPIDGRSAISGRRPVI